MPDDTKQVFGAEKDWPQSQPVNSEHLAARLKYHHEPVTLRIVEHTGHVGLVNGFRSPRFSPVLEETLAWIGQAPVSAALDVSAPVSGD